MNALPQGITGFDCGDVQKWSEVRKSLVAAVWAAGGKVERELACNDKVEPNYHFIVTSSRAVLVHSVFKLVACADTKEIPYMEVPFADWPALEEELSSVAEWKYLTADFLNQPLSSQHTTNLGEGEMQQVQYWKPKSVGNLIFNNWD